MASHWADLSQIKQKLWGQLQSKVSSTLKPAFEKSMSKLSQLSSPHAAGNREAHSRMTRLAQTGYQLSPAEEQSVVAKALREHPQLVVESILHYSMDTGLFVVLVIVLSLVLCCIILCCCTSCMVSNAASEAQKEQDEAYKKLIDQQNKMRAEEAAAAEAGME